MAVLQGVSTDLDGLLANGSIAEADTPPTPPINGTAGADGKLGTGVSDLIRGLGGNDTLTGDAGFDTLDGGAGADSMIGGTESDTYFVNSAGDRIDETGGGTDDRIFTSIAIDLSKAAYAGIEHVTLAGVAALRNRQRRRQHADRQRRRQQARRQGRRRHADRWRRQRHLPGGRRQRSCQRKSGRGRRHGQSARPTISRSAPTSRT